MLVKGATDWNSNYIYHKACDQITSHSQTSTAQPLKFGTGYIISSHILLNMCLFIHTGIKAGLGSNTFYQIQIQIYKYIFFRVSNTNTNTPTKIWSNTNTDTNTAHQIQIQIHTEAETKLTPFYRWHTQIHSVVRTLFYLFKFQWKLFPKVQSTISLAACFGSDNGLALSRQQAILWPMMVRITDA